MSSIGKELMNLAAWGLVWFAVATFVTRYDLSVWAWTALMALWLAGVLTTSPRRRESRGHDH